MSINNNIIDISQVSFGYGNNLILDNISLTIKKGSYVGIIGPNGGGKTTLLKILLGLLKPQQGTIKIQGVNIADFDKKYEIGYVPQRVSQENFDFPATVYEIVSSGRTPMKKIFQNFNHEDKKAIVQAMNIAGIFKYKDKLIGDLSGGERQRVYAARALATQPQILILDEPFVGIDIASQQDFYQFLRRLNSERAITIIFVSHDVDVITNEVKEIICLNRRLVCQDKPKNILLKENILEELYGKHVIHIHHG